MSVTQKKLIFISALLTAFLLAGCSSNKQYKQDRENPNLSSLKKAERPENFPANKNHSVASLKDSEALDLIFNNQTIGHTTITMRRSEWNKMLAYYDFFYKNENTVQALSYEYEKENQKWVMNGVGFRMRGNTSRFRPQGKDTPNDETGHRQQNGDWNAWYYDYAKYAPDSDYRQSHFKVDFQPYKGDQELMAGLLKGVALKRTDTTFCREIFCYDLFRKYGVWTSPRASHTTLHIKFIEDLKNPNNKNIDDSENIEKDISVCKVTDVNFGVYEMFEEVGTESLKARTKKKIKSNFVPWENAKGDLWKCSEADLTVPENPESVIGIEDIFVGNLDQGKENWQFKFQSFPYDLKTNKKDVNRARQDLLSFMKELDDLKKIPAGTKNGTSARKAFYEKWFDVDLFLKTYAVNVLVGMDDDYWGNRNNYYLYFDNGKDGSGKCFFIPFDYDNTLGQSIDGDGVYKNPLTWGTKVSGEKCDRPLLDRIMEVPEYKELYKNFLLEVSSQEKDSPWNKENCFERMAYWKSMIEPYMYSDDIKNCHGIGNVWWYDEGGWKEKRHFLTQEPNIYEETTESFRKWLR